MEAQAFFQYLRNRFPNLEANHGELVSDLLLSPFEVKLPKDVLAQAQKVVASLYDWRERAEIDNSLLEKSPPPSVAQWNPRNKSICMSYDFHLNKDGQLKLIEVNTNAAFLLMGYFVYEYRKLPLPIPEFNLEALKASLLEEVRLNQSSAPFLKTLAIIDEAPSSQKLFIEFLLYKEVFEEFGWNVVICDPSELEFDGENLSHHQQKIDFVYNRSTDFFLDSETHSALKRAYLAKKVVLSPNPHEYFLLADKKRMLDWTQQNTGATPHLLKAHLLTAENSSDIWAQRKTYFFKPLQSFGSKGTYRGEGISRVYFDQLIGKNILAQEFCPAPEVTFLEKETSKEVKLKYDLRFYAYKGEIQMVMARLYQGQVTNLRTPMGGFAPVLFD